MDSVEPVGASVTVVDEPSVLGGGPSLHGRSEIVVARVEDLASTPGWCDVGVTSDEELDAIVATVATNPIASRSLVELLRCSPDLSVAAGLLAESATYAALQASAEFRRWRESRPVRPIPPTVDPIVVARHDGELRLTLNRPTRRNALDTSMRDALAELLSVARHDSSVTSVVIDGSGPSFCGGGDLDEFGSFPEPGVAHLVRLERSLGRMLAELADRTTVRVHGACVGSGIELAAFARHVTVAPDVSIGLPEISMGLVPGAGGTVSLPRRIGRHRTAWLALTGRRIDATTALRWGLADSSTET